MLPEVVKVRLWNLALRMNPQTATYGIRIGATTPDGADTFTNYKLLRVTYRELTNAEMQMANATLADVYRVWVVYQADLDQAKAPAPKPLFTLTFADGTTWVVERTTQVAMNQAHECLCRKAH